MTPIIRPLRNGSGTLYAFPSAVEDIGLNLDSTGNRVALSRFAVLNIPRTDTTAENPMENRFDITNIPGVANILNNNTTLSVSQKVAAALQNYMMNFETVITNQADYDYSASATVSERVFWKFLKETGAIRWKRMEDGSFTEEDEVDANNAPTGYRKVVKSIGRISAANSVSGEFGMYNETYVNIPSTYGASRIFFKSVEDSNYRLGHIYTSDDKEYLAGRDGRSSSETYSINVPVYDSISYSGTSGQQQDFHSVTEGSDLPWYRYTDETNNVDYSYFTEALDEGDGALNYLVTVKEGDGEDKNYNRSFYRSRLDGMEIVSDLNELSQLYRNNLTGVDVPTQLTYDSINIDNSLIESANYDFNAILLYYTVYDRNNDYELATNLFGIVFLNSPQLEAGDEAANTGASLKFYFPTYEKIKSNGPGTDNCFGTGYSFKVNIRSLSVYDNTDAFITDETTQSSLYTEDFSDVVHSLARSVELLQRNSAIISGVYKDYIKINGRVGTLAGNLDAVTNRVNDLVASRFDALDVSSLSTTTTVTDVLSVKSKVVIGSGDGSQVDFDIPRLEVGVLDASSAVLRGCDVTGTLSVGEDGGIDASVAIIGDLTVRNFTFEGDGSVGTFVLAGARQYLDRQSGLLSLVTVGESQQNNTSYKNGTAVVASDIVDRLAVTRIYDGVDYGEFEVEPLESFGGEWDDSAPFKPWLYEAEAVTNIDGEVIDTKGYVNYLGLVPVLLQEIKNLRARVAALESKHTESTAQLESF